jgi:hypothetical protein
MQHSGALCSKTHFVVKVNIGTHAHQLLHDLSLSVQTRQHQRGSSILSSCHHAQRARQCSQECIQSTHNILLIYNHGGAVTLQSHAHAVPIALAR